MRKLFMLLLAAPILACGPVDPIDPDGGDPSSFTATLSMSLPSGSPAGDFLVDGETVCTNKVAYEHKVHAAGVYEITSEVTNSLCVLKTAEVDSTGDLIMLDLPCGLAPNGFYEDSLGADTNITTTVIDGQIKIYFEEQHLGSTVNGNTFRGNHVCESSGTISNDLMTVSYTFDCGSDVYEGTMTLVE